MKNKLLFVSFLFLLACNTRKNEEMGNEKLNLLAEKYARLGLNIGQYDPDFADAYYGPDSLKPLARQTSFPKDSFLSEVAALKASLQQISNETKDDTVRIRANWITQQLTAFSRRIKSGNFARC